MRSKRNMRWVFTVIVLCHLLSLNVFAQENKPEKKHEPITQQLITMVEHNAEIKKMLTKSIEKAKKLIRTG